MEIRRSNLEFKHFFLLFTVVIAWSLPPVLGRLLVTGNVPALTLGFFRYFIAGLSLFVFLWFNNNNFINESKKLIQNNFISLIITACFLDGLVAFLFLGVETATASVANILLNVNGTIIFILSILFLKEQVTKLKIYGTILAFTGSLLIIGEELVDLLLKKPNFFFGALLTFFAGASFAIYSVLTEKEFEKENPGTVLTIQLFIGSFILVPFIISCEGIYIPANMSDMFLILILGLFSTAIAFAIWFKVLREIELGRASSVQFLIPIFGIIESLILLEEKLTLGLVFGGILTTFGVILLIYSPIFCHSNVK